MYSLKSLKFLKLPSYVVYLTATFFSILLSIWISSHETVINPDAICYLQSAATMKSGIHAAMNLCGQARWPFYSLLIAGVVSITKLSYITAAYMLDGIFSWLTVLAFIGSVAFIAQKQQAFTKPLLWLAALIILLAPQFNAVKTYIIRDHGFWAFYVGSLFFLLCYFHTRQWRYALAWGMSAIVATLFRIEGAIFLLIIPLIAWCEVKQSFVIRFKTFLQLNAMTIIAASIVGCWFLLYPSHSSGRLSELQFQLLHGVRLLQQNFQLKATGLAMTVLGNNGARDATTVLTITLLVWYLFNVIANLSLIFSGLLIYSWWKKLLITEHATRLALWSYVLINVIVTAVFLGQNMFLSKRYLIALSLVLMLWVPFALSNLMQQWQQRKWPFALALLFIAISSLGGIFDLGYSKQYMQDAGRWLAVNVPQEATVYSNDLQVMYYSQRFGNQIFAQAEAFLKPEAMAHGQWKKYDYLALRVDLKELRSFTSILHEITLIPIQVFHNKRGDQVRIYRRSS